MLGGAKKRDFIEITQRLKQHLADSEASDETIQKSINDFYEAYPKATAIEVNEAMQSLSKLFFLPDEERSTAAMMICGNLMEKGYYAKEVSDEVIEKMAFLTESAFPFYEAFKAEYEKRVVPNSGEDDTEEFEVFEVIDSLKDSLWDEIPDAIISWNVLEKQYIPAVSVFSLDIKAYDKAKKTIKFVTEFAPYNSGCDWLSELFSVLFDESVLVIEPETSLGFIGKMSGVADYFQLQGVLMDVFPQRNSTQPRISEAHANVFKGIGPQQLSENSLAPSWSMYYWQAITDELLLPEGDHLSNREYRIWYDTALVNIPEFEGFRTILLGKPTIPVGIGLQRVFGHLKASIQVDKELSAEEVTSLLYRMLDKKRT